MRPFPNETTPAFAGGEEGTEMVSELSSVNKVVGAKQVRRALNDGRACKVFLACDADPRVVEPLARLAQEGQVPVEHDVSMADLGAACGIAVKSAAAALVR